MGRKERKITRYVRAPIRALARARDLYVRTMNNLAGQIYRSGGPISYPTTANAHLHRSYSLSSASGRYDDADFRELLRVASAKSLGNKIEMDSIRRQQSILFGNTKVVQVPRSQSVAIGRIDEDHTCDFGDVDMSVKKIPALFPRSSSVAFIR